MAEVTKVGLLWTAKKESLRGKKILKKLQLIQRAKSPFFLTSWSPFLLNKKTTLKNPHTSKVIGKPCTNKENESHSHRSHKEESGSEGFLACLCHTLSPFLTFWRCLCALAPKLLCRESPIFSIPVSMAAGMWSYISEDCCLSCRTLAEVSRHWTIPGFNLRRCWVW